MKLLVVAPHHIPLVQFAILCLLTRSAYVLYSQQQKAVHVCESTSCVLGVSSLWLVLRSVPSFG